MSEAWKQHDRPCPPCANETLVALAERDIECARLARSATYAEVRARRER